MTRAHLQSLSQPYCDILDSSQQVVRWRLFAHTGQESNVGFVKKSVADIYNPASQKNEKSLSYAIEFESGSIAYGNINPTQVDPRDMLALAKSAAVVSRDPLMLPPAVDESAFPRLISESGYIDSPLSQLLPQATELRQLLLDTGCTTFEGALDASYSEDSYHDSSGLSLYEESAMYGALCEINGRLYTVHNSRTYPESYDAVRSQIPQLSTFAQAMAADVIKPEIDRIPVFIPGGVALLNTFLLAHMNGMSVATGSSRFKPEDFQSGLTVAHQSFNLSFDQTQDMERSSFAFTTEGIASQRYDVIKNGRLVEPICNLKSAHQLGYKPRVASSAATAVLDDIADFETLKREVGTFLIAFTLLGVHSQNNMTGDYSLPCPDTLYFKDGELVGPVKAVITGNFFEVLKSGNLKFARSTLAQAPVVYFDSDVTFS